jgi:hypothetical protein
MWDPRAESCGSKDMKYHICGCHRLSCMEGFYKVGGFSLCAQVLGGCMPVIRDVYMSGGRRSVFCPIVYNAHAG